MQQFVRVQQGNVVIPGLVSDAGLLDLRSLVSDITPDTIASGILSEVNVTLLEPLMGEVRYLAPISGIRQLLATGFNYRNRIEEVQAPVPTKPEVFLKSLLSLTGPFDGIRPGPENVELDCKTELAIVIGREVEDIQVGEAADYIFGYVCLSDVSDRSAELDAEHQHLVRAKSRPTYCPIGPYLTTDIDPMNLDVWTKVNGLCEQHANTIDMSFSVYDILAYVSRYIRMVPGDVLATGASSGVSMGKNRFLAFGDILECGITHLGAQRHQIVV
jgi:2,4-diketo-3-deoxy-L-fuconate hydrolase